MTRKRIRTPRAAFWLWWAVFGAGLLAACSAPSSLPPALSSPSRPTRSVVSPSSTWRPAPTASPSPAPPTPSPTPPPTLTPTPTPCADAVCVLPGHFVLAWPVPPPEAATLAYYPFGGTARGRRDPHHGADLPAAQGTPVRAPAPGEVVFAGADDAQHRLAPWPNYYGQAVVLRHTFPGLAQPVFTLFGHLDTVAVAVGQRVAQGDLIGTVGSRGVAVGPHLHLEVRLGRNDYDAVQNPLLWLRPPEGTGVVAWRITDPQGNALYFDGVASAVAVVPADGSAPSLYLETYADPHLTGDPRWHETQALGNLPAGAYRLQVVALGCPHEMDFAVQPGRLTLIRWRLASCP